MVNIAIDSNPSTVLFLAANPAKHQLLDLGEECRAIEDHIRGARFGAQLRFRSRWAARPGDLLQALHENDPAVLHFSGHGAGAQGLCFLAEDGGVFCVSSEGLRQVVEAAGDRLKLVVLNACYTTIQAEALIAHVPCVIGMPEAIGDKAAITYAADLYRAIAFGKSVAISHQCGLAALALFSTTGKTRDIELAEIALRTPPPVLLTRVDVDAKQVYVVQAAGKVELPPRQEGPHVHVEIDLDTDFETISAGTLAKIVAEIQRISGGRAVKIVCVTKGSVRLTVALWPEAARRLVSLQNNGGLSRICEIKIAGLIEHGEVQTPNRTSESKQSIFSLLKDDSLEYNSPSLTMTITAISTVTASHDTTNLTIETSEVLNLEQMGNNPIRLNRGLNHVSVGRGVFKLISNNQVSVIASDPDAIIVTDITKNGNFSDLRVLNVSVGSAADVKEFFTNVLSVSKVESD